MYADLPDPLKRRVLERLMADDFRTAKQIYDLWQAQENIRDNNHILTSSLEAAAATA